jgi:hypothetical protein
MQYNIGVLEIDANVETKIVKVIAEDDVAEQSMLGKFHFLLKTRSTYRPFSPLTTDTMLLHPLYF